jgi:hypothetical protein
MQYPMKHIVIDLNKDEALQIRRGGKIDYFLNNQHIEIRGPKDARRKRVSTPKKNIPVQG